MFLRSLLICLFGIDAHATEELKQKYLPKLATAEWIGAWGLTEANTGSDAGRMKCVAKKDGDHWVINGTKNFITHGLSGDVAVVIVRTGELLDSHGMTAFIVERGTPGFSGGKKENKLGMRCSETAEMIFDDCRIPEENVLGEVEVNAKNANSDPIYKEIRNLSGDSNAFSGPYAKVNNLVLKKDEGVFTFRSGEIYFLKEAQRKRTGAVFIGDGELSLTPPVNPDGPIVQFRRSPSRVPRQLTLFRRADVSHVTMPLT